MGGRLDRGAVAAVSWTHHNRLHIASVYNQHEGGPQHEEATRQPVEQWQEYLSEIAGAPWIIGDWNLEPQDADCRWDKGQAVIHDIGTATQKQGRNIDWLVAGARAPTWEAEPCVIPGTDHVGVTVKLQAVDANTLGVRMEQPTRVRIDRENPEEYEQQSGCIARSL